MNKLEKMFSYNVKLLYTGVGTVFQFINKNPQLKEVLRNNSRASCKTPIMLNNLLFYTRNLVIL